MAKKRGPKLQVEKSNVFFTGLKLLDEKDGERIKDLIYEKYETIARELKVPSKLKLHFKKYQHGGREKFSVNLLIDFPGKPITAEKVYDPVRWDVIGVVHKLMEKARKEIVHKLKTDASFKKYYY